jgi:DNA segregation ATPase FtsK/SpoIIIE, S-DNA-T family
VTIMYAVAATAHPHPHPSPTPSVTPGYEIPGGPGITLARLESWLPALKHAGTIAAVVLAVVLLLAMLLRWKAPRLYWWLFGAHLLRWRMRRTWRSLTLNADLTTTDRPTHGILGGLQVKGQTLTPLVPPLCRIRSTSWGATAVVVLLPGQTPDAFTHAADVFAHAWRVHAVRVTSPQRGRVALTVLHRDPLVSPPPKTTRRTSVPAASVPVPRQTADRSPAAPAVAGLHLASAEPDHLRVDVGRREDGAPWVLDLNLYPHWLITGATRSGKSTLINAALIQWAPLPVALVGIDCKGGMELAPFTPRLSALACDRNEAATVLAAVLSIAHARMRQCRISDARNIWQLDPRIRPVPIVVVVDELAELYLVAGKEDKDAALRATTALLRLAQLGAALGIHLIVAGQRVGSDLGSGVTALRAQLAGRVCHKVNDPETADMTLGDLYPDAVDAAQTITATEKGVAITTADDHGWIRAKSGYTTPQSIAVIVNTHAHRTPTLPGLTPPVPDLDPITT